MNSVCKLVRFGLACNPNMTSSLGDCRCCRLLLTAHVDVGRYCWMFQTYKQSPA